ncbi:MAG: hypothetical protein NPMRD1_480003 [Nitrosopumilales archaeon]|nr:MAG: hypothetical protein NPMRD1_480003 [Nitrosopumilales archaeon]
MLESQTLLFYSLRIKLADDIYALLLIDIKSRHVDVRPICPMKVYGPTWTELPVWEIFLAHLRQRKKISK